MEASSAPRAAARRHDIDWLRIAAVLLLIPYHTARVFNWEEDFYIKNDPTDGVAQALHRLRRPLAHEPAVPARRGGHLARVPLPQRRAVRRRSASSGC